jgi:plasmid stabilization system protein ParE
LKRALELLGEYPRLGRAYPELPGVRMLPLKGTPYFLFHEINEDAERVDVVAVWSRQRGEGPDLG